MTATQYIGIDLSLTSTGLAKIIDGQPPKLARIQSKPLGPTLEDRARRAQNIVGAIIEFVFDGHPGEPDPTVIAIEAPTYGAAQNQGSQHDRAGLWWAVVRTFLGTETISEISPTTLKAFTTGKGNSGKPEMMARTAQEWPGVPFESDDDSDALWLATMARCHADPDTAPVTLHAYRTKALKVVAWQ